MTYHDRLEQEHATGYPAHPCPHCGYDGWAVESPYRKSKYVSASLFPAICEHCHVLENALHVDGFWMGRHAQSGYPGSLCRFVSEHAEYLRGRHP